MEPKDLIVLFNHELYAAIKDRYQSRIDEAEMGIRACLELLGLKYAWRHNNQSVEDFVEEMVRDDKQKLYILDICKAYRSIQRAMQNCYECVQEHTYKGI